MLQVIKNWRGGNKARFSLALFQCYHINTVASQYCLDYKRCQLKFI